MGFNQVTGSAASFLFVSFFAQWKIEPCSVGTSTWPSTCDSRTQPRARRRSIPLACTCRLLHTDPPCRGHDVLIHVSMVVVCCGPSPSTRPSAMSCGVRTLPSSAVTAASFRFRGKTCLSRSHGERGPSRGRVPRFPGSPIVALIFCPHWSKRFGQEHRNRRSISGCVFRRRSWSFHHGGDPLHPVRSASYRFGFNRDVIGALDWKGSRTDPKDERRPHEARFPRETTWSRWHGRKESATWRRTAKAAP